MTKKQRKFISKLATPIRLSFADEVLHERITDRVKFPLSSKTFFKSRLKFDYKLRQEYRGLR